MATTYVRNPRTNEFEKVGAGSATTDTTLSQLGKPADAAAVGSALTNYALKAELDNRAPMYAYGTTDLTAGSSTLPSGTLYFYYTTV